MLSTKSRSGNRSGTGKVSSWFQSKFNSMNTLDKYEATSGLHSFTVLQSILKSSIYFIGQLGVRKSSFCTDLFKNFKLKLLAPSFSKQEIFSSYFV